MRGRLALTRWARWRGMTRLAGPEPQRRVQVVGELGAARVAVSRVLRQRRGQNLVHGRGQVAAPRGGRGRRRVQLRVHHGQAGVLPERRRAAQQLEPGAGQRVQVRAPVERPPLDLLGRDVVQVAHELAHRDDPARRRVLADPEVGQVHVVGLAVLGPGARRAPVHPPPASSSRLAGFTSR